MIKIPGENHWLKNQAELYGGSPALICEGNVISYSELLKQSCRIAAILKLNKIEEGEPVGILLGHSKKFVKIINALWFIGALPVPLNSRNSVGENFSALNFLKSRFLITDLKGIDRRSGNGINVIDVDGNDFNDLGESNLETNSIFDINNNSLILFTSGSTGKPKAVVHTFKSLYESVLTTDSFSGLTRDDLWLASLPFYHIGGFMILIRSLLAGSAVVIPESINFSGISEALTFYNPTHISLVSTTLKQLLDKRVSPNKKLKCVYLGGGPLDTNLCREALINGFPVIKVYGSTETCSMVCALSTEQFIDKSDSAGRPVGNNKIKIIDAGGNECPEGQSGEILIKCGSIFKEYYNNPEETGKKKIDSYYHTGDYGFTDGKGFLFVGPRKDDVIITGGENVNTKEVEQFIIQLPSVIDAFVYSEKDPAWGDIICAAVVTNKKTTSEEIRSQLKNMMASFKVPKRIYLVDKIPRNEIGKVERDKLNRSSG
ncbi:MAG TPA: o-succinylbenzoate--CoA ligase [Melioribacteraceae bacterium]|nr:o-succinylbenzoate--CoA ligase [Melioribacteraceae bacterium]